MVSHEKNEMQDDNDSDDDHTNLEDGPHTRHPSKVQ